jgi:predicted DNA-binding protein
MKEMVGVRLETELKGLLQDMADKEHRPLSNYIRFIILDWLSTHKGIDWPPKEIKKNNS